MKINDDWQGQTSLTLDTYHLKEVEDALAELDWLERQATPKPWTQKTESATAGVRELSNECAWLRAQNRELKKQVIVAEEHAPLWGHWCAVLTRRLNWFRDLFRLPAGCLPPASGNQGGVQ